MSHDENENPRGVNVDAALGGMTGHPDFFTAKHGVAAQHDDLLVRMERGILLLLIIFFGHTLSDFKSYCFTIKAQIHYINHKDGSKKHNEGFFPVVNLSVVLVPNGFVQCHE